MSHDPGLVQRCKLVLHVLVWSAVPIVAGWYLTAYLVGTLGDPLVRAEARLGTPDIFDSVLALTEKKVVRHLGEWEFLEPKLPGHFHHVGRWYQADRTDFCITCHGPTPHARSPQQRAFLNMHTLFTSCRVCHAHREEGVTPTRFAWIDIETGTLCPDPAMEEGVWGEYGAKIVPLSTTGEDPQVRRLEEEEAFAAEFTARRDELDDRQKVIGNKFIHRRCQEEPIRCSACHTPSGAFLSFADLGYSAERADFLMSAEVVDLVARYETFHLSGVPTHNGSGTEENGESNP